MRKSSNQRLAWLSALIAVGAAHAANANELKRYGTDSFVEIDKLGRTLVVNAQPCGQVRMLRTTGAIDTTGWVLIAVLHGSDASLVQLGQQVRAFSVNSRTRLHRARVTRVTTQPDGVRVEATLEARVLGVATRYLMEIAIGSI